MKERLLKKGDALREGYVKGLKRAQRIINETIEAQTGTTYTAKMVEAMMVEDSYEHGEDPSTKFFNDWGLSFNFTNEKDFFENLGEKHWIPDDTHADYDAYNKQIRVYYLGDKDWSPLYKEEIEKWKQGKIKGYACYLWFKVTVNREATDKEMLSMFEKG